MPAVHSASSHARPPPLTQSDAVTSLLSLGLPGTANDNPAPIPISSATSTSSVSSSTSNGALGFPQTTSTVGMSSSTTTTTTGTSSTTSGGNGKHHRRLGSTGKTRRRLSDAREASTRPHTQHSLLSLASLSLSTSPGALSSKPLAPRPSASHSTTAPSGISISGNSTTPVAVPLTSSSSLSETAVMPESSSDKDRDGFIKSSTGGSTPIPITSNGKQKKRGVDYKCESCAKIYRHPNCLNKHRWEHTRQWREASKFVLSKHQQVQLLEAAAILSYMGTSSTSLPEDRSEWPSFLSGGSLPKADGSKDKESKPIPASIGSNNSNSIADDSMSTRSNALPLSTSVPIRMSSHGPRMHDFPLPVTTNAGGGIGVVGPASNAVAQGRANGRVNLPMVSNAGTFMRPLTPPLAAIHNTSSALSSMMMDPPGWISHIPSSSIRSESSASGSGSRSRSGSLSGSRSRSRSDGSELEPEIEEEEDGDVDVEIMDADVDAGDDERTFGVPNSMTRTTTTMDKAYPVSSHVSVPYNGGAYPPGSYGSSSYRRPSAIQDSGEYGSFSSSSHRTANVGNGTSYPKPTEHYGNTDRPSTASRNSALRGNSGTIVKAEADETMQAINDNSYERRWDGMEMEVDMDMD